MKFPPLILLMALPAFGQEVFTLPGGLQVKLFENHERPLVEARLEVTWDGEDERGGLEGAGLFLGAVLDASGAGPYGPAAWRKALDDQGILLRFQARPGRYLWTLQCPTGSQEAALEFLAHAVARPLVDGPAVETQRARLQREGQRRTPTALAEERFRWEILEGRPEGILTVSRLARLSHEQLLRFQNRVLRPSKAMLALHGDLAPAQARQLTQLHLGIWGPTPQPRVDSGQTPALPTGLAQTQGHPEARLALLAPDSAGETAGLLALLLERWLEHPAGAPPGCEGSLLRSSRGPILLLQSGGPAGTDPLQRLGDLRTWADALASRPLGEVELAQARRLQASWNASNALHPARQLAASFHPPPARSIISPADLKACLARWIAPQQMRVLLLGCPAPPREHPALKGLEAVIWAKTEGP